LRGEILLHLGQGDRARSELAESLDLARRIGYPTITWQAAHLLARAEAGSGHPDQAVIAARLVVDTLDRIAARLPDAALRRTFQAWPRVVVACEEVDRLLRG
jgi:hypothetical protein